MRQILFFILCISLVSATFAETDIDKNTQLIQAAKDNNFAAVQALLAGGADVNAKRSTEGTTALMWAALNGNTKIVRLLLEKGADVNAKSDSGLTALAAAKSNGHKDIVQLLEKPAATAGSAEKDVSEKNTQLTQPIKGTDANTENFALHKAAYEGNLEEVKALIAKGADVNARGPRDSNFTPLLFAAAKGHENIQGIFGEPKVKDRTKNVDYPRLYTDIATLLLVSGADVNAKGSDGSTALHLTAQFGYIDMAELLIAKGADIEAKHASGATSLSIAALNNHKDIENLLIAKGAKVDIFAASAMGDIERVKVFLNGDPNMINAMQVDFSPLHAASYSGQTEMAKFLIEKGADVNAKTQNGRTPLFAAAHKGHKDIAELLIAKGADVNAKAPHGGSPLFAAVYNGSKDIVELLIAKGADVNAKAENGWTTLLAAVYKGRKDIAELLIAKGADVNVKTQNGRTPLLIAADEGWVDMTAILLTAKDADINIRDEDGRTPLFLAADRGHKDLAELLIAKGADINAKSQNGRTPLFTAASKGHPDLAELLIAKGADINAKTQDGGTPLFAAAKKGHPDIAELLIAKGANVNAKNNGGKTPLVVAADNDRKDVVELLIAKGADVNVPGELFRSPPGELFLGSPGDSVFLFGQWNGPESFKPPVTPRPGSTFPSFRWTAGNAGIRWPITGGQGYQLQLSCIANQHAPEPNIFVNGQYVATIHGTDWQFLDINIPAKIIGDNTIAQVEIKGRTWVPAQKVPPNSDTRNLGVMVAMFSLTASSAGMAADQNQPAKAVTFKSAEPAPDAFDAWTFKWKTPTKDPDAAFWYVVIQPDGQEYFRYDLPNSAASHNIRSDFRAGSAGGDPRVFYNEYIKFSVRTSKGKLIFPQSDSVPFKFEFFKKNPDGKIDWNKPFKTIDAVIEP